MFDVKARREFIRVEGRGGICHLGIPGAARFGVDDERREHRSRILLGPHTGWFESVHRAGVLGVSAQRAGNYTPDAYLEQPGW